MTGPEIKMAETSADAQANLARRHRSVAAWCAAVVVGMAGLAYAAVPLYGMFCRVTGYGGTTQVASQPSAQVVDRVVTIRFDANVAPGLPWTFEPVQRLMDVKLGENSLAFYRATNRSDQPVVGTATFNVSPDVTGVYFNKLACFCFNEQRLEPGESVEMPVSFFVDPAMLSDADARKVSHITLSYTFYRVEAPKAGVAQVKTGGAAPAKGAVN